MTSLTLMITRAGQARFTAAQLDADINLGIAQIGLTDSAFLSAPTLEVLPGEFKRLASISGEQVGDNIVHMTIRDESPDGYTARGFGLFLADGTLFATYAQADRLFEKSPRATFLAAIDIAFPAGDVAELRFGNTDFLNPPATTERKGVVELATDAEIADGVDAARAVTPKGLQSRLIAWFAARKVLTSGLATGGRALDGDVTINVAAASAAEADAGIISTKAVVPSSLANIVASILARVPMARRVETAGLAIGGNALTTDITISVPAATAAQLLAGSASNVAATPAALAAAGVIYLVESKSDGASRYRRFSDGSVEMSGISALPGSEAAFTLNFPWPFPTACDGIWATIINSGQTNDGQSTVQEVSLGTASAQLFAQNHKSPTTDAAGGFRWFARGR
jgi:hypothetical protein